MVKMIKIPKKEFYGTAANEEWHPFISSKNSNMPFVIENIGTTHPHPNYCIKRDDNKMFIIEYVVKGKGYIVFNDKTFTVEEGDTYILEPGIKHCYFSDKNNPMEKVWINFTSNIFLNAYKTLDLQNQFIFKGVNTMPYFNELFEMTRRCSISEDICLNAAPVLFDLLYSLARSIHSKGQTSVSPLAVKIKSILDNAMFSSVSIDDIAKEVNFSKKQISREFKKFYNDSPHNYLLHLKIKMAKRYLKTSNMSIKEIADVLAFENQHYFSSIFKKKVGVSPASYRSGK